MNNRKTDTYHIIQVKVTYHPDTVSTIFARSVLPVSNIYSVSERLEITIFMFLHCAADYIQIELFKAFIIAPSQHHHKGK